MSKAKRFKLRGYNEVEYFWVYIYDSLKEMRRDCNKHGGINGYGNSDTSEALAIVEPYTRVKIHEDGSEEVLPNIGIIRLVKNKLHTHIVSHELVHAAMHHYRLTQKDGIANFGDNNCQAEEDFGFIYCKYFSKMSKQLYKHGFWK